MVAQNKPETLAEALRIRAAEHVVVYAGGTDIMVDHDPHANFLFINGISSLKHIEDRGDHLLIGAGVTYAELLRSDIVPELLKRSIVEIAAPALKNIATLGGNICNASPLADTPPVLSLYDTTLILEKTGSMREMRMDDFMLGLKNIDLKQDELLTYIKIPKKDFTDIYYEKIAQRKAASISKISFAAAATVQAGLVRTFRFAFGSISKTPLRLPELENMVEGRPLHEVKADADRIVALADEKIETRDGKRSTGAYRKKVALRMIRDFIGTLGQTDS
ncbi:MAG TPA: xanthine dehydrogenase family protein subunit M [Clostridiaceae bacterium]|nr:xanthine dehydrogenase family protein subunit M [Clostridiaceae bacterium]